MCLFHSVCFVPRKTIAFFSVASVFMCGPVSMLLSECRVLILQELVGRLQTVSTSAVLAVNCEVFMSFLLKLAK
jgi:hypothetical protein